MGLVQCPDCGNMVSDRAAACPSCGCPAEAIAEAYGMGGYEGQYEGGYEDSGDNGGGGSSGPGFLSSVLRTAAGVALGNKLSDSKKRNYMDSPNCERAKTGRKSSCWGCGLGDYCTMHDKY